MTATRHKQVIRAEQTKRSGVLVGSGRVIRPVIDRLEVPWQYDHTRRAYKVPLGRLDDVLLALELDGHRVDVALTGWCR